MLYAAICDYDDWNKASSGRVLHYLIIRGFSIASPVVLQYYHGGNIPINQMGMDGWDSIRIDFFLIT